MTYLDFNATTPLRPEALAAMSVSVRETGNPASLHAAGQAARRRTEAAQESIRTLVGAGSSRVVLTASGSEANVLAVLGIARRRAGTGKRRVLLSAIEHPCVRAAAQVLAREGLEVTPIPVLPAGTLDLRALEASLDEDVALLALMLANNETGALQPVAEAAQLAARWGVPVHTDAVQAAGKIPLDFAKVGAASLALAGHKLGGPKGIGALVLAPGVEPEPLWGGGGQQHGLRSGTPAVLLAVGLAAAADAARAQLGDVGAHARERDRLEAGCISTGAFVVSGDAPRLPNTAALGFPGVRALDLVYELSGQGIMVGAGAACHTGEAKPSAVLGAMGVPVERALSVVRFSTGWTTTAADIDAALAAVTDAVSRLGAAA